MSYTDFITQNIAPINATKIGVYNSNDSKIGKIDLINTFEKPSDLGKKLYSFGVVSDIHLINTDYDKRFINALNYFNNNVDFVCISGDLTAMGKQDEFEQVKSQIDTYATVPVYLTSGNHDCYNYGASGVVETALNNYFNTNLYYTINKNNDVFIFAGHKTNTRGSIFTTEELQWLYETLEENRNKRCFLIQHSMVESNGCGDANNLYGGTMFTGNELTIMKSLMSHYKNIIHFHGHSHLIYELQKLDSDANYSNKYGSQEIHVPSLKQPRTVNSTGDGYTNYDGSEGCVVDVYSNYIIVKGRDFINNKFLPIAYYCLNTSLKNIDAYTYTDSTNIINTSSTYNITNNLSNASTSNTFVTVTKKTSYSAIITANVNYEINKITVTMGGIDITSTVVSGNNINIPSVIGDIIITVTTTATVKTYSITNNLSNATNSNTNTLVEENTSYSATITANSGYKVSSIIVTMGGIDITSTVVSGKTITISSVTGNVIITVTTVEPSFEEVNLTWVAGSIHSSTGEDAATNGYIRCDYVDINTDNYNYYITVIGPVKDTSNNDSLRDGIMFGYDENKTFISQLSVGGSSSITTVRDKFDITDLLQTNNAKYIRMRLSKYNISPITVADGTRVKIFKKEK